MNQSSINIQRGFSRIEYEYYGMYHIIWLNIIELLLLLVINPTISHLKASASASQAFREKIRKAHPDAGGTAKEFKEAEDFDVIWRDGIRWDMEYEVTVYVFFFLYGDDMYNCDGNWIC